jgi:hypothetical protein
LFRQAEAAVPNWQTTLDKLLHLDSAAKPATLPR